MLKQYNFLILTGLAIFLGVVFATIFILQSVQNKKIDSFTKKSNQAISAVQSYDYRTYPKSYLTSLEKAGENISDSYYKTLKPSNTLMAKKTADIKNSKSRVIATPQKLVSSSKQGSGYILTISVDIKTESMGTNNKVERNETSKDFVITWKKEGKDYKITSIKEVR